MGIRGILLVPLPFPSLYCHCIWVRESELNKYVGSTRCPPWSWLDGPGAMDSDPSTAKAGTLPA